MSIVWSSLEIIRKVGKMVNLVSQSVVLKSNNLIGNTNGPGNYLIGEEIYNPRLIFACCLANAVMDL